MAGERHVAHLDPFALLDVEADRVYAFFTSNPDWDADTRCEGWRVRELLAHVDGVEVYHTACLDDRVQQLFEEGGKHGATDMDSFNDWLIRDREDKTTDEVIESWRRANLDVRKRLRERGRDGSMASSVGPYPVGLMAFHVASEYATHADDMHVAIPSAEADERTAWRLAVSRFALEEASKPVTIEEAGSDYGVSVGDKTAVLRAEDLVEAVTARLPKDFAIDPEIREALRALA
jgi:uncharacterized protein (TIGR03083 family)